MNLYDEWCEELYELVDKKRGLFLLINTFCFGMLGLLLWLVIHFFFLNRIDWLLCFVGYPAMCFGYMGGLLYFLRKD